VADAPLNVQNSTISASGTSIVSGRPFTLTNMTQFTDANPNDTDAGGYIATIDWGDGSSDTGTVSYANGTFSISASEHTYPATASDTTYDVRVTILDADGDPNASSADHSFEVINGTLTATAVLAPVVYWDGTTPAQSQNLVEPIDDTAPAGALPAGGPANRTDLAGLDLGLAASSGLQSPGATGSTDPAAVQGLDTLPQNTPVTLRYTKRGGDDVRVWQQSATGLFTLLLGPGTS